MTHPLTEERLRELKAMILEYQELSLYEAEELLAAYRQAQAELAESQEKIKKLYAECQSLHETICKIDEEWRRHAPNDKHGCFDLVVWELNKLRQKVKELESPSKIAEGS